VQGALIGVIKVINEVVPEVSFKFGFYLLGLYSKDQAGSKNMNV